MTVKRQDFQIVQLSIQRTHLHLLVEAQVRLPRTWLLKTGWKQHGETISCFEVPSAATLQRAKVPSSRP